VPQSRSQTSRSFVSTDFFNRPSLDRSGLLRDCWARGH
jgi:hypothetical protein